MKYSTSYSLLFPYLFIYSFDVSDDCILLFLFILCMRLVAVGGVFTPHYYQLAAQEEPQQEEEGYR